MKKNIHWEIGMEIWLVFVIQGFVSCTVIPHIHGYKETSCRNTNISHITWINKLKSVIKVKRYPGEWWIADCQVKNVDVNATLWQKLTPTLGRKIIVDGMKLKMKRNVFNLTNIGSNDTGWYYCTACGETKRVGGFKISTDGKAFQYPKIINKPNSSIEFGVDMKLVCEVSGWYDLVWSKDGVNYESHKIKRIYAFTKTKYLKKKSELTIKNFSRHDEGVYSCNAKRQIVNWDVQDKVCLKMKAFVKPTFMNIPDNVISLKQGETLHLQVLVTGYPKPDVHCWNGNKEGNSIMKNGSLVILHISRVVYSLHNGTRFHCTATNINGSSTRKILLNIWVKPKVNTDEPVRNKTISVDNTTLDLVCKVDEANPLPVVQWRYRYEHKHTWLHVTPNLTFANVMGNTLRLHGQNLDRMFYKCVANNSLGEDVFTWKVLNEITDKVAYVYNGYKTWSSGSSYFIAVIIISSIVTLLILGFIFILYKRKKVLGGFYVCTLPPDRRDYIEILDESKFIHEQTHKLPYISNWEFPRENILLQEELGSGAFGVVYLAHAVGMARFLTRRNTLKDKNLQRRFSFARFKKRNLSLNINDCDVVKTAVKTLKVNHNQNDLADILSELKVLIHVGEHENVLRILGACTKAECNKAPLIILEYCPHGNLKEFLRARRDIYEPEWKEIDEAQLSITDIATFALHIVKGMEFLISRKCIHRDLAARNVLISGGYVAKISDFGLARDVYDSLEYVKVTPGLLPIKWMAIEAIQDRIFNEKTDVWSYGIVLWEMFTLGGTPYPDHEPSLVLYTLLAGERMCPPIYCPQEISDVMLSCWYKDPLLRPSFTDIVFQLQKLCDFPNTIQEPLYQNVT